MRWNQAELHRIQPLPNLFDPLGGRTGGEECELNASVHNAETAIAVVARLQAFKQNGRLLARSLNACVPKK
jgi:hypothetical protein